MMKDETAYPSLLSDRTAVAVWLAMIALLCGALFLNFFLERGIRQAAAEQFNQQQRMLARYAARQLEDNLELVAEELRVLNYSPSIQYLEAVSWARRMEITMSVVKRIGALSIARVDVETGQEFVLDCEGNTTTRPQSHNPALQALLTEAQHSANKGKTFVSTVVEGQHDSLPAKTVLLVSMPTYQDSVDEAHPKATGEFVGVTLVTLDVTFFVRRIVEDIRSGQTGYAWVIDDQGTFLYYPFPEFIGKNSFTARQQKEPGISFGRINEIQRQDMLTGKEGTDWYLSGWPGTPANTSPIRKLIAYAPVHMPHADFPSIWSVAVVAPENEVDEVIRQHVSRMRILYGVIVLALVLVGLSAFVHEWRWKQKLEHDVEIKTRDLRRSEERYRSLVENACDMIYSLDREGKILSINRHARNLLANGSAVDNPNAFDGQSFLQLVACERLSRQNIIEAYATGEPQALEHRAHIGDKRFWFSTNLIPIKNRTGEVRLLLGISRDITEQKKMINQMANTEKLASLGLLTAGIAHEINNPIAIIKGYTEHLLEEFPAESEVHDVLDRIIRQSRNCEKIVAQTLSFSRMPEQVADLTDINKEIEDTMEMVANTLFLHKIKITANLAPDIPRVKAEPRHLQQVFLNLMNNAGQAMSKGGTLTVTTSYDPKQKLVQAAFADIGHGIALENRARIFDAFFTTKKPGEGTGLGLTVSYNIVSTYGGTMTFTTRTEAEADAKPAGTTFVVSLPAFIAET